MNTRIDQQFGSYRLEKLIGRGGFAEVYLGVHIHLRSQVAIKVLNTQLMSREQEEFLEEARIVAALDHSSIVRVLDCGIREEDETPYLVMNYAPNGTLRQRHPKGEAVPFPLLRSYVKKIASALQYAHDKKLIHRDIKPENMLIGINDEILLSDFGIALMSASSSSQSTKAAAGTIAYMAPEQIMGKPRTASDQYALGVVVYEWLCGERPFHGNFSELCAQQLYAPPPSLQEKSPTISPELEAIVLKALAKEPSQRYSNVQEFADALAGYDQQPGQNELVAIPEENIATYISTRADPEEDEPTAPRIEARIVATLITPPVSDTNGSTQRAILPVVGKNVDASIEGEQKLANNKPEATIPLIVSKAETGIIAPELEQTRPIRGEIPPIPISVVIGNSRPFKRHRTLALLSLVLMLVIIATSFAVIPQIIHATPGKQGNTAGIASATKTNTPLATFVPTSTATHAPSPTAQHKATPTPTDTVPVLVVTANTAPIVITQPTNPPTVAPTPIALPTATPTPTPLPTATPIPPTPTPTPTQPPPPTATPTPTQASIPATLQANPSSSIDSFNNSDCPGGDTHGGGGYIGSCTYTLSNTSGSTQILNWTGSVSNSQFALTPNSGSIAPGQTQSITLSIATTCPLSLTITLVGPSNTVQIPIICTQILVTPSGQNFSTSNCTHAGGWTCVVTVSADSQNGATTHWSVSPTTNDGTSFSPSGGSLAPGATIQVTITIPATSCPTTNRFDFTVAGGEIDGFDNFLPFSC